MLYIIGTRQKDGWLKIGVAQDPEKRLRTLQTAHHERLQLFAVGDYEWDSCPDVLCEERIGCFCNQLDDYKAEKVFHQFLIRRYKVEHRGEWFKINLEDIPDEGYFSHYGDGIDQKLLPSNSVLFIGWIHKVEITYTEEELSV